MSDKPVKRGPGRPKGSLTRNLLAVRAAANSLEYNLVAEYIKTIAYIADPVEKAKAQQFLFKYMYPSFKEVEITSEIMTDIMNDEAIDVVAVESLSDEELLAQVTEEMDD